MALRSVVCCSALCLSAAAAFADDTRPPRALGSPGDATENCYRQHSREGEIMGEAQVAVSVDSDGRVTGAMSEPGTREPLASAAQCVAVTLMFEPALQDGQPVPGKTSGVPSPTASRRSSRSSR